MLRSVRFREVTDELRGRSVRAYPLPSNVGPLPLLSVRRKWPPAPRLGQKSTGMMQSARPASALRLYRYLLARSLIPGDELGVRAGAIFDPLEPKTRRLQEIIFRACHDRAAIRRAAQNSFVGAHERRMGS